MRWWSRKRRVLRVRPLFPVVRWEVNGEPPYNLPPGNYEVKLVSTHVDEVSHVLIQRIRYVGPMK